MGLDLCVNEDAHLILRNFAEKLEEWEKSIGNKKAAVLHENLQYFQTDGVAPFNYKPLDTCCKRFISNIENVLSGTSKRFRLVHDNFWDTWGHIAGLLLTKHENEDVYNSLAFRLQTNLKKEFSENRWDERQLIIRSFVSIADKSIGYDNYILETIDYFYAHFRASMSAFCGPLPREIQESIKWGIMAQKNISIRFSEIPEENDQDYCIKALTSLSLQSLEFISRIWDTRQDWDALLPLEESVFSYMFPVVDPNHGRLKKGSEAVRKAFEIFENHLIKIRQQQEYNSIHLIIEHWLGNCKEFRKVCI